MYEKTLLLKIKNQVVEVVDWDITIDELEMLKGNVAFIHCVEVNDIDVSTIEVYKPEVSETTFVGEQGLTFKAPNPYSMHRPVSGLNFSFEIEVRRLQNGKEAITENGLNILLEKIAKRRADDVIIYS